jgi:uncharacterized protein with beta-barrel porin domain
MVRIRRKRAAVGDRANAGGSHPIVCSILLVVAALLWSAAGGGEAAAQCIGGGGGGPFIGGGPNSQICATFGNTHLSSQAGLLDIGTRFQQRLGALSSFGAAAGAGSNPQGGGAETTAERYRAWLEGYGTGSRTDGQASFSGDRRTTIGVVAGAGVTVAPGITVGLSVDQGRTKISVTDQAQSGRINLTQIGAIAGFENGPWNLSTTLVHGFGGVHSARFDTGASTASYRARLWGAMAELSYFWALPNNSRFVPKLTFDWIQTHTDPFTETGGATPVSGSAVNASRVRMLLGAEIGHSWLMNRTIMDFLVYGRLVDNLSQHMGTLQISDPGANLTQFVSGVKERNQGGDAGATLSAKVTDAVRLYAVYDGRFRSNFISHTGTAGVEVRF